MTDQLKERLREHIGKKIELLADRIHPDWQQSDSHTLKVTYCVDTTAALVVNEFALLRERVRQLEEALREIQNMSPQGVMNGNARVGDPNAIGYNYQFVARAILNDTPIPTPEEGERDV